MKNWTEGWDEQQGITPVKCERVHCGFCDCLNPGDVLVLRMVDSKWCDANSELMFLPDENERYGCVPTCPSAGMDQSWHVGFGLFEPGQLPDLAAFTNSGKRTERNGGKWRCVVPWNSTHSQSYNHIIDVGVSMSSQSSIECLPGGGTEKTETGQNKQHVVGTKEKRTKGTKKQTRGTKLKDGIRDKKTTLVCVCVLLCVLRVLDRPPPDPPPPDPPCVVCVCVCVCCVCVWSKICVLRRTAPPPDRPSAGPPKISFFFPSPATIFIFFLSLGVFSCLFSSLSSRGILVVFFKAGALKCVRLGSRAHRTA